MTAKATMIAQNLEFTLLKVGKQKLTFKTADEQSTLYLDNNMAGMVPPEGTHVMLTLDMSAD